MSLLLLHQEDVQDYLLVQLVLLEVAVFILIATQLLVILMVTH
jgi:hypothetical protein